MALSQLAQNTIFAAAAQAKQLNEQIAPLLARFNVLYNAVGGLKTTILQADMDAVPALSGLQKAQLDNAMNDLTNTILTPLQAALADLAQLAGRAS